MTQYDGFDSTKDIPDLSGKVIILTGGTGGVGKQAILQLAARHPSHIIFTGRNQQAADAIISSYPSSSSKTKMTFVRMDLASLADIKSAAEKILSSIDRIDIFIANAGIRSGPGLTKDGYEIQFGTNHLGNAALLLHLLPLMVKTAQQPGTDVRFVALTSLGFRGHPGGGIIFDSLKSTQEDGTAFGGWGRYGQSKLANIIFAREVARRYPKITSCAVHPGVVETDLVAGLSFWSRVLVRVRYPTGLMTPEQGSLNTVWAATSGAVKEKLAKGKVALFEPVGRPNHGDEKCFDEPLTKKLWEWTEEQVGVKAPTAS